MSSQAVVRWMFLVIVALVGITAACGDNKCELGRNRCVDGFTIERCVEGYDPYVPPHWVKGECFSDYFESPICAVAPTGNAYCAAEKEPRSDLCPVPAEPTGEVTWTCDGTARIVGCVDGLVGYSRTCGTGVCVISSETDDAFCSILTEPDPLCGDGIYARCADATTRIQCREGYRVEQDTCTGAGGCQLGTRVTPSASVEDALCALASAIDPRCDDEPYTGQTAYCDGNTAINCFLGYPVSRYECARECYDHGYWSECLGDKLSEEGFQYGDPPDCADGFDNDYDGLVDYPDDPGCAATCCGSG